MVLHKEYRICMPMTVEEYRVGQLYMIAKHTLEKSEAGDGVEIVVNEPCEDAVLGKGQHTVKHVHLSSKLPAWVRPLIPRAIYIIEKAWNYYPHTITEYSCSVIPRFSIRVETRYEDNNGSTENAIQLDREVLDNREVVHLDIAHDEISEKNYKKEEDCTLFKSRKTGRGPLTDKDWKRHTKPIMCSYKLVSVTCGVWGLQSYVENKVHEVIREILLVGHRQAFVWLDEWHGMTMEDVRRFESQANAETNKKTLGEHEGEKPVTGKQTSV